MQYSFARFSSSTVIGVIAVSTQMASYDGVLYAFVSLISASLCILLIFAVLLFRCMLSTHTWEP